MKTACNIYISTYNYTSIDDKKFHNRSEAVRTIAQQLKEIQDHLQIICKQKD